MSLTGVAQAGSNAVDGDVDAASQAFVGIAAAMALEQLDLQVIERIHVGRAQLQGTAKLRVVAEKIVLFQNAQQMVACERPFATNLRKDTFAQISIADQFRVA